MSKDITFSINGMKIVPCNDSPITMLKGVYHTERPCIIIRTWPKIDMGIADPLPPNMTQEDAEREAILTLCGCPFSKGSKVGISSDGWIIDYNHIDIIRHNTAIIIDTQAIKIGDEWYWEICYEKY